MQSSTPVVKGLEPFELKIGGPDAGQPQYQTLHALRSPDGRIMARWTPDAEERKLIAKGADIFITLAIGGNPYPPTLIQVRFLGDVHPEAIKSDMSLDDELALRILHNEMGQMLQEFDKKKQEFAAKSNEVQSKLAKIQELRNSI